MTKLQRGIKKGEVKSFDDAANWITDGEGSRLFIKNLDKLSREDIKTMVKDMKIADQPLTKQQEKLLLKYIYNHPMSEEERMEAFPIFEKFCIPLVEKRSQPQVDSLLLSVAKHRLEKGELTIEQIKQEGMLSENLIKELESNPNIESVELLVLENYRGVYGIGEFSNRQIQSIRKICGDNTIIRSRQDVLDYERHPGFRYTGKEREEYAIKTSGYRTAQINVRYKNGALGEIQFRGCVTNAFGERQHLPYNFSVEKDFILDSEKKYKRVYDKLTEFQQKKYNQYFEDCFNYYFRIEHGLPAVKPKLPKGLKEILSDDSLKTIHEESTAAIKELNKDFKPHFSEIA